MLGAKRMDAPCCVSRARSGRLPWDWCPFFGGLIAEVARGCTPGTGLHVGLWVPGVVSHAVTVTCSSKGPGLRLIVWSPSTPPVCGDACPAEQGEPSMGEGGADRS